MTTNPASSVATFDAASYKSTTKAQWDRAAEPWFRWGPTLHAWLGPATQQMLDRCHIQPGAAVLDVAAGAGEQTLAAARRVGPAGSVLATDLSPRILEFAAQTALEAGFLNITTQPADAENLTLPESSFDAVISRLGVMFFPDLPRALNGCRRVLKPGGRFAAIVFSTAQTNGFLSVPMAIARRRANAPAPLPGRPGAFSLGAPGVLEQALRDAGFRDVEATRVAAPVRLPSAADCLRFARESFGALHEIMDTLKPAEQEATWAEIGKAFREMETKEGFVGPCELLIVSGTK